MKPYIHSRAGRIADLHWNVDYAVGKHGQNIDASGDVSYVQWYYTIAANHPRTPEERKAVYRNVRVNGFCRGTDDDPLVAAITIHQRHLQHPTIDGKISVARGSGMLEANAFFILRLGARFADMYPDVWPRVDLIPNCPGPVRSAIKSAIPHI